MTTRRVLRFTLGGVLLFLAVGLAARPYSSGQAAERYEPLLLSPGPKEQLRDLGPQLRWQLPEGATQVQVQVLPAGMDGPSLDAYLGDPVTSLEVLAPPAWYGLLPDMTYIWRVRASFAREELYPDHPAWSAWVLSTFRTPMVRQGAVTAVEPAQDTETDSLRPLLQWSDTRRELYNYEVQLSADPAFGDAAPLYWERRHGGVTSPKNSYRIPAAYPLEPGVRYYWRVRPRVQGDGTPVAWEPLPVFSFTTSESATIPVIDDNPAITPTSSLGTAAPLPPPPYAGYHLLFHSNRDGTFDIYSTQADAAGLRNLTSNATDDRLAVWSPDGARITFLSNRTGRRELFLMKTPCGTGAPACVGGGATGDSKLETLNSEPPLQLSFGGAAEESPAWTPDGGSRLAFVEVNKEKQRRLRVVYADGHAGPTINVDGATQPAWFPDTQTLVLAVKRGQSSRIGRVRTDEPDPVVEFLVREGYSEHPIPRPNSGSGAGNSKLETRDPSTALRAGSELVLFVSARDGVRELYVVNRDGTGERRLTFHKARIDRGVWSPEGSRIAFSSNRDGSSDIYVISVDGLGATFELKLTAAAGNNRNPVWSPDGKQIAFESDRTGFWHVYVMNADGSNVVDVSPGHPFAANPFWSPRPAGSY